MQALISNNQELRFRRNEYTAVYITVVLIPLILAVDRVRQISIK